MELKIGRNIYTITEKDSFMDNGTCVQLLTQSEERSLWGRKPHSVLSKRAIKEISNYKRVQHKHNYGDMDLQIFNLKMGGGD